MKHFRPEEFLCTHCEQPGIQNEIVEILDQMREECGFPFVVTPGYRCPDHPIEARKERPGAHAGGYAVDLAVDHGRALQVVKSAMDHGIKRIGVNQKGDGRFIHVDVDPDRLSPAMWSY